MGYFVTGATGFIGRHLVEELLKREGPVYVLIREGSKGRLEELRSQWGISDDRVIGIAGDLAQPRLGVVEEEIRRLSGKVDHLFHLAAVYDITADPAVQELANVEGTRHAVELAEAVDAGCVHLVSSIAAAGLYRGTWREEMFEQAEDLDVNPYFRTKHESERVVREQRSRPWRIYRPGIVVGHSETGEMDKVDGPYYFFKLIRRVRAAIPQWMPIVGIEGGEINLVPVDFVAQALCHIAHRDGLDGETFHLTDPSPRRAGEVIDIFARAAHAPESAVRVPNLALDVLAPAIRALLDDAPLASPVAERILAEAGIPREALTYVSYPTHFDSRQAQAALEGSDIRVPPLEAYAGKLWDYWERHLDPDLFSDRTLVGAVRGRRGMVTGIAAVLGHQIPDEVLRFGRRLTGQASLEKSVRGRVVMVTGASSGIGRSAALKIAAAGGIVLLVARTPEKLEATREGIEAAGGTAHIHRCDLSDLDDIDRMADEVLAEHGGVDVLVNNAGRSIRRSIALSYDRIHDFQRTMQLNYLGAVKLMLRVLPGMRQRRSGQIVNVSSIGVQTNTPRFSAYVASKAALDAFSRCVASEVIDDGVYMTTIHMPLVRTPMIAPTGMYKRFPAITSDEAADMICEAIIHRPKRIATPLGTLGQLLYALNPRSIDYILNSAYHLFPDSSAARGTAAERGRSRRGGTAAERGRSRRDGPAAEAAERETSTEDGASREQLAFAYLMRGIHW